MKITSTKDTCPFGHQIYKVYRREIYFCSDEMCRVAFFRYTPTNTKRRVSCHFSLGLVPKLIKGDITREQLIIDSEKRDWRKEVKYSGR